MSGPSQLLLLEIESKVLHEQIAALTKERDELKKHEAICHCGINYSSHTGWDGHSFVEMQEMCPYQKERDELKGQLDAAQKRIEAMEDLICKAAPIAWCGTGYTYMHLAHAWEREAAEMLRMGKEKEDHEG